MKVHVNNISKNTGLKYNKRLQLFYGEFKEHKIFIKLDTNNNLCHIFLSVKYVNDVKKHIYSFKDMDKYDNNINIDNYNENPYATNDMNRKDIQSRINILKATCPVLESITYKNNEITAIIKTEDENFTLSLYTALNDIIQFCNDNKLVSCCINCGKSEKTFQYSINEHFVNVCNHCHNSVYFNLLNKPKPEYVAYESFIAGTTGVLIGAFILVILLFFLNINITSSGIMGVASLLLVIPVLICFKLYIIFSGGFFTKKSIIITSIVCLMAIFFTSIFSEAYMIAKDTKQNFDNYMSKYELELEQNIESSYEDIIKKYNSTESYFIQKSEDYKEYLTSRTETSTSLNSVFTELEDSRSFRLLFMKKLIWCIAWLISTIICVSFHKYNYDKKSSAILLH